METFMKYYFLVNPMSGNGKHTDELCAKISKACDGRGVTYEIHKTTCVGDATVFVRSICADSANLPARFFACGGDGTLGEVANGIGDTVGAQLGLIPVGTGNDFARNFDKGELFFDIDAQLDGAPARIDLLRWNGAYAVNMINIGFDCEVVKKKEKLQKHRFLPSKLAYIFGLVITLVKKPGLCAEAYADGERINESNFLLSTFANGCFCGGGFHSNPFASVTDGTVDALFVRNISRSRFVSLVGSYKKGTHIVPKNEKLLFSRKARSILLKFPATQSISVDGEIYDCDELHIECVKDAIDFIVPKGVDLIKKRENKEAEREAVMV